MSVTLAGLVLPNVENHSLSALRDAVEAVGIEADVMPFGGWPDIEPVVRETMARRPAVFGISMQNTESALASIVLAKMLRRRGFRGRIVCGGHFATLNAADILKETPEVDVVVKFAGEEALVALARGATADALAAVPGVLFRDASGATRAGAPPRVTVSAAPEHRAREALPRHLGFPAADIVASHGCEARCAYCCVAGASALAHRETAAAESATLTRHDRRPVDDLVDELAWLWHERGARVFNFMDDNLLPLEPAQAEAWTRELSRALTARGVGRFAFSLQLRADVATPPVVDALVELGLARAYVGIDGFSGRQLVALGRAAPATAGPRALETLATRGVFSVCNALLIGPTFRFESILAEIGALAAVEHAPVHLLPLDVRAGTTYFARADRRGLLEGGCFWRRYRFEDPKTELLAEAVLSFPSRLEEHSVPLALYDLGYNLGIARRLLPDLDLGELAATYASVARRWNADQLRVLRAAAKAADTGRRDAVTDFVRDEAAAVERLDVALLAECARCLRGVEARVSAVSDVAVAVHARGRLLSAVAFSMALASCGAGRPLSVADAASDSPTDEADADDGPACPTGLKVAQGLPYCPCRVATTVTFDAQGLPIDVVLPDGTTPDAQLLACVQQVLAGYCYPSLAGQTHILQGHCWVA